MMLTITMLVRILEIEYSLFTPLVMSSTGGLGPAATTAYNASPPYWLANGPAIQHYFELAVLSAFLLSLQQPIITIPIFSCLQDRVYFSEINLKLLSCIKNKTSRLLSWHSWSTSLKHTVFSILTGAVASLPLSLH